MTRAALSVLLLLGVVLALFWLVPEMPLLGFAGVLIAVALRAGAEPLAARTGLSDTLAVVAVLAIVAAVVGLAVLAAWGPLTEQASQLADDLPRSLATLRERLEGSRWGRWVLERADPGQLLSGGGAGGMAMQAASRTLGVLGDALLVLLAGVYVALQPGPYLAGLTQLFDPRLDARVRAALADAGHALRGFLLGQAFAMVVSGALTFAGLWLLGVPLAGVLAVITAILGFIPVVGPVIAAVPAVLLALLESPTTALWVAGLFVVIQTIEGNILTPMVQSRTADVPPAMLIVGQLLLGTLYGLLGVALAAPMLAVGIVLVRRGYVEGWLGRPEAE